MALIAFYLVNGRNNFTYVFLLFYIFSTFIIKMRNQKLYMTDHAGPRRSECPPGTKLWSQRRAFVTQFWHTRSTRFRFCKKKKWLEMVQVIVLIHTFPLWRFFLSYKNGNGRQNRSSGAKTSPRLPKLGYKGGRLGDTRYLEGRRGLSHEV